MEARATSAADAALRAAVASPLRLEILGLFGVERQLSVSDMAARIGRPATSLYHHLGILVESGLLRAAGTRPKGKRFETVYEVVDPLMEVRVDPEDESGRQQVTKAIRSAFRMAERDFEAALEREDLCPEGPGRNLISLRVHMRATPEFLAELNERLDSVQELLASNVSTQRDPGPDDQFLSLTLALLPLRGRQATADAPETHGDEA